MAELQRRKWIFHTDVRALRAQLFDHVPYIVTDHRTGFDKIAILLLQSRNSIRVLLCPPMQDEFDILTSYPNVLDQ